MEFLLFVILVVQATVVSSQVSSSTVAVTSTAIGLDTSLLDVATTSFVASSSSEAVSSSSASVSASTTSVSVSSAGVTCLKCDALVSDNTCGSAGASLSTNNITTEICTTYGCWFSKYHNGTDWFYKRGCLDPVKHGVQAGTTCGSQYNAANTQFCAASGAIKTTYTRCCSTSDCNTFYETKALTTCQSGTIVVLASSLGMYAILVFIQKIF